MRFFFPFVVSTHHFLLLPIYEQFFFFCLPWIHRMIRWRLESSGILNMRVIKYWIKLYVNEEIIYTILCPYKCTTNKKPLLVATLPFNSILFGMMCRYVTNTNKKPYDVLFQLEGIHGDLSWYWGPLTPNMKLIHWRSKAASHIDHGNIIINIQELNLNLSQSSHRNYSFVGLFNSLFDHCHQWWKFPYDITRYPFSLTNIETLGSIPVTIRLSYTNGIVGNHTFNKT